MSSSAFFTSTFGIGTSSIERSEEHTSELQSQSNLVCRLLLEKKKIHHFTEPVAKPARLQLNPAHISSSPPPSGANTGQGARHGATRARQARLDQTSRRSRGPA